ncbi:hypothetical protein QNA24_30015 [Rhodococcus qingshengii]|uniref:hypothetical protein n=1 Tax=Rhodococcus TaxID=1827 RepID=UPI001E6252EA|nr:MULTISPECIES: hypothetical protein [Rhodococcus]MCD2099606.1 hypothetical protein [Rhodococcus rhodochrous]MCD2123974.1 hypothetical protein [Rhodococcus rhodochrous]MCQ4136594.1 hypothetical protein [Rhodococcus rhodochrous]MDJ0490620.1 hypothetical protein [Rhodococcus qingshengii]
MSTETLARILATHQLEYFDGTCTGCDWDYANEPEGDDVELVIYQARHVAAILNERYAVVELPKADHEPLSYNGAGWSVPAPHHQVFDGYFEIESSDSEFGDEDAAEKFALALLACARHRRARIAADLPAGTLGRGEL